MDHKKVERWSGFKVWLFGLVSNDSDRGREVVDLMRLTPDDRFLDIGCGLGGALEHAVRSGASVAGVDPSPGMVSRASKRVATATVKVGSAEDIPFPDASFTAVVSVASFHHWADRKAGLDEVSRVLAPGGRLLVAEKRLKQGQGHGLSGEEAGRLVRDLESRGFEDGEFRNLTIARHPAVVVTATRAS